MVALRSYPYDDTPSGTHGGRHGNNFQTRKETTPMSEALPALVGPLVKIIYGQVNL
jgi:hypothetical protein